MDQSQANTSPLDSAPNLVDPNPLPTGCRDWFVPEAVQRALDATSQFDEVTLSGLPETQGSGASGAKLAAVLPMDWDELDDADGPDDVENVTRLRFALVILVRNGDPAARDRELDRLVSVAKNAIDGANLIPGWTLPAWTKLRKGKWLDAVAPERRQAIVGECAYGFGGNDQHDTEE